jgi:hypothetical protein
MIENDYLLAWSGYLIAAVGCLLVWFRITRWMWRYLREPLRVLGTVVLFSPTIVDPAKDAFAPAIAITALDLVFQVGNNVWRAVADLAMYSLIALTLYLLFVGVRWPLQRWWKARNGAPDTADDPRTLRQRMAYDEDEDYERYDKQRERGMRVEPRLR